MITIAFLDIWLLNPYIVFLTQILLIYINFNLLKYAVQLRNSKNSVYSKHYAAPFYVLNPSQRGIIGKDEPLTLTIWLTWITQTFFVVLGSILYSIHWPIQEIVFSLCGELVVGLITGRYLRSILTNISNIYLFRMFNAHPQAIKGRIQISTKYLFSDIRNQLVLTAGVWFLIFLLVERIFFLGGSLETILIVINSFKWEKRAQDNSMRI